MDTNQPASPATFSSSVPSPGVFGTKVPSVVAFIVVILLFLMPFVDIRCNGSSLKTFTGVQLATGFDPDVKQKGGGLFDDIKEESVDVTSKATGKKKNNLFILVALIAGGAGLLLSLTSSKALIGVALVAGLAGAGGLIAGMVEIKKEAKTSMKVPDVKDKIGDNDVGETIDKAGDKFNDLTDNINISVDFTPWFYITVIAFLVAAYLCYRRMSAIK